MAVKTVPIRQEQVAGVKQGAVSGTVLFLAAVAGRSACYEWQWSPDQNTWCGAPLSLVIPRLGPLALRARWDA